MVGCSLQNVNELATVALDARLPLLFVQKIARAASFGIVGAWVRGPGVVRRSGIRQQAHSLPVTTTTASITLAERQPERPQISK